MFDAERRTSGKMGLFAMQPVRSAYPAVLPFMGKARLAMTVLFLLAVTLPRRVEMAQAAEVPFPEDVEYSGASSTPNPCEDHSMSTALREALYLVCSRGRPEIGNRKVRKAIILGFVGGFVKPDDVNHPEVLFAAYLRSRYRAAVHAEIFGNHEGKKALQEIIRWSDNDEDGLLTATEKKQVKIILYGHSWGASQTLVFARELQKHGFPVALTFQIDSVKKFGQDDHTVPVNVAKAVNFYQRKGLTPGRSLIVPADPARTKILGNFLMTYEDRHIDCDNYKWLSRVFNKHHHEIENDPRVWDQMVSLIDSELSATNPEVQSSPTESLSQ